MHDRCVDEQEQPEKKPATFRINPRVRFTPEKVEIVLNGLAKGYTVESMAAIVGISRETIYKRRERDNTFRESMIRAMDISVARLEQVGYQAALNPENFVERKFIMINRARDRWRDRTDLTLDGVVEGKREYVAVYEDPEAHPSVGTNGQNAKPIQAAPAPAALLPASGNGRHSA